ncbi:MAG: DNA polymerase III subunit beta [Candidatus Taylorbacteria bacterium]|nr:DNA polymerase III subunit beta [Candidatus Taylorbacteria bacterium]
MRIECLKEKLQLAISSAERVTGKNLTLPILSCIELKAHSNILTIRATNLDLGLEINIPVKITEEGTVAVPGGVLNSFLSNLANDKNVTLETKDQNLIVSTSFSSTVIKTFPSDDFPTIPSVEKDKSFIVSGKDFARGLKSVWYSSAVSSMKPELSSVFIYIDDETMVFAATDSFRLAEKKIKVKKGKEMPQLLIPFKNVPEIIKTTDVNNGDIEIFSNKNQLAVSFGGTYLTSRIIDGVFPDYKQIIPKESKTEAIILKQDLINALKISNIFSDKFHQLNVKVTSSLKKLELKTKNADVGESINLIQAAIKGEDIEINFNYKYIADCFQSIDADSVSLQFNGLNRPMVIRGVSDRSFMYLVMPMNR